MSSIISPEAISTELIWRFSVQQYHAMIQAGILNDDDSVELLEGWLVRKMPKNPPHRVVTRLVRTELEKLISVGWYVDSQEPITLADSEPEPDVVIVRGETRQYLHRHPGAEDVAIVVEVADTTLQRDRTLKKRTYARARIPVYWLVNLVEQQIEVYTHPLGDVEQPDYQQRQDYRGLDLVPVIIQGAEIGRLSVDTVLP